MALFNINIDTKTVAKQIENSKLKQKVIVTAIVLIVVVIVWFILDYTTRRESTIDESFAKLAEPFTFALNEETLSLLDNKEQYTGDELQDFTIYLLDSSSVSRGNSLIVYELGADTSQSEINIIPLEDEVESQLPDNIQTDDEVGAPVDDLFAEPQF